MHVLTLIGADGMWCRTSHFNLIFISYVWLTPNLHYNKTWSQSNVLPFCAFFLLSNKIYRLENALQSHETRCHGRVQQRKKKNSKWKCPNEQILSFLVFFFIVLLRERVSATQFSNDYQLLIWNRKQLLAVWRCAFVVLCSTRYHIGSGISIKFNKLNCKICFLEELEIRNQACALCIVHVGDIDITFLVAIFIYYVCTWLAFGLYALCTYRLIAHSK